MTHKHDPDRIGRAIEQLRNEPVPVEGKLKMTEAMRLPRRHSPARWIVAGVTTALIVEGVLLWPQPKALAWSQVVSETLAHTRFHTQLFMPSKDGKGWQLTMDMWEDGEKHAVDLRRPDHWVDSPSRIVTRFDGKQSFIMQGFGNPATDYGVIIHPRDRYGPISGDRYSVEQLLKSTRFKAEGDPIKTKLDGEDVLKYVGHMLDRKPVPYAFYADPVKNLVVRWDILDESGKTVEYGTVKALDSIPASQFEPPYGQMPIYDMDKVKAQLAAEVVRGTPIGAGNELRAVVSEPGKELLVIWSGMPLNDDGSPRPSIEGYKVTQSYSPIQFGITSQWARDHQMKYKGENINAYAYVLDRKATGKVTLDLPILEPDKSKPVRGVHGELYGYATKRAGTKRITVQPSLNVPGGVAIDALRSICGESRKR